MPVTTFIFIIISTNPNFIFRNISQRHGEEPGDARAHPHRLCISCLSLIF